MIEDFESKHLLGVASMDDTHREFVDLVNALENAGGTEFADGFAALLAHTTSHFDQEQVLMQQCGFPAIAEHTDEHRRVLGEMARFARQVEQGRTRMAQAYVKEALPPWFALHAATMDSALAGHLKRTAASRDSQTIEVSLGKPR